MTQKYIYGNIVTTENRGGFDRKYVANPFTLFEYMPTTDTLYARLWDKKEMGGGTEVLNSVESLHELSVGSGGRVISQTKSYIDYQPGKTKEALFTGVMQSPIITNCISKIGLYDDVKDKLNEIPNIQDGGGDGHYFKYVGGVGLSVVEKKTILLSPYEEEIEITQNNLNMDTMDGNGPSGLIYDPTKSYIYYIKTEWLGVGSVEMGVLMNNELGQDRIPIHIFKHEGIESTYMRTAKLPVRYEIDNINGIGNSKMKQICCTLVSIGGYNPKGLYNNISVQYNQASVSIPLILRLKQSNIRTSVVPLSYIIESSSFSNNEALKVEILLNPTLSGTPVWNSINNSAIEYSTTTTSIINEGYKFDEFIISGRSRYPLISSTRNAVVMSSNIMGESDILVVLVSELFGAVTDTYLNVKWIEY